MLLRQSFSNALVWGPDKQLSCRTFDHKLNLYASLQEILIIKDKKADQKLLFILSNMSESTNNSQKVCRAVAAFEIFYITLKYNHNELHYRSVRKQSLWKYLWCSFEYDW